MPDPTPATEDLATFLRRQDADALVGLLLELAESHEPVRERLARLQLSEQPDALAAEFRRTLTGWRRSRRFHGYRESRERGHMFEGWLDEVARELLPRDPRAALALFEAFIEADTSWFDHSDDSDGAIGQAVRAACRYWLTAAARCDPPPGGWARRLIRLREADQYGARDELLGSADLLFDEPALRSLVAHYDAQMSKVLASAAPGASLPIEVYGVSAALTLLSEALRDPDVRVRAVLRYSPEPNPLQRESFAQAYLEADRPADALPWLQGAWGHQEDRRLSLMVEALDRLGRRDESARICRQLFERTLAAFHFRQWLERLPESERAAARADARQRALDHADPAVAAALLLELGDADSAEARLIAAHERFEGASYAGLTPLVEALRAQGCLRGETVVLRALLVDILDRAQTRAYGHAARYWSRLGEIASAGADLSPLPAHAEFEAGIRSRHGRKVSFWGRVQGTRDAT
ncbi:MAG: DUF6880 family protein [Gammaproteobacteria bacterium]